ncbi:Small ribosomal subunit protein [Trichinella spiralis]|uniref:Small ribosomal subunit protein n=1 Tax=Trichinella spiralis TaxID=6334 RepID=A0ABR3K7S0_TRISP
MAANSMLNLVVHLSLPRVTSVVKTLSHLFPYARTRQNFLTILCVQALGVCRLFPIIVSILTILSYLSVFVSFSKWRKTVHLQTFPKPATVCLLHVNAAEKLPTQPASMLFISYRPG